MQISNVTVFGSGVLGAQIAFQTAFHGFFVTLYDLKEQLLDNAKQKFNSLGEIYRRDMSASADAIEAALQRIAYTTDLAQSVNDADLAIEAIPENLQIKKEFYAQLSPLAPQKTIFCTNSSTLLPSQFAQDTGRPDRFLTLHFAHNIWKQNTAEIMGHPGTGPHVFETILDQFMKQIPMARMGTTDEISPLALFLASKASSYCTGSLFYADGGAII